MTTSKATLVLSVLVLTLTGCKVTTSDSLHYPDSDGFVSGLFYDARDTGRHYPTSSWALGRDTEACRNEPLYFETPSGRVRV